VKDPSDDIQVAYVAALTAAATIKAKVGDPPRVFDEVPTDPVYPYIRVGDDQCVDDSNGCSDAWEMFCTFHTFSRGEGALGARAEVKQIHNAMVGVLVNDDTPLAPLGFKITEAQMRDSRVFMEADGVTAHGALVVRYLIDATA
jgi:hypothetical protein